jgi:hypothetical protein
MAATNTKAWRPIMNRKTFTDYQDEANAARKQLGLAPMNFWGTSKEAMKVIAGQFQAKARDVAAKHKE